MQGIGMMVLFPLIGDGRPMTVIFIVGIVGPLVAAAALYAIKKKLWRGAFWMSLAFGALLGIHLHDTSWTMKAMMGMIVGITWLSGVDYVIAGFTQLRGRGDFNRSVDLPHKDLRRARAAALSMIPSTTGAAKAVAEVLPALKGKLNGCAVRVPTPNVSLVDLTVQLEKAATVESINAAFKAAAAGPLKGVLYYSDEPTVSIDYNGNPHSSIFDATTTQVIGDGTFAKVFAWYDNEWGFSNRMVDVAKFLL